MTVGPGARTMAVHGAPDVRHPAKDDCMPHSRRHTQRALLFIATATAAWACHAETTPADDAWRPCADEAALGPWPALDGRLACRELEVPLDATRPDGDRIKLDIVRVKAVSAARGTLLVEPDTFSAPHIYALANRAMHWLTLEGTDWPAISNQFDLVTVSRRRFPHADGKDCVSASGHLPGHVALGNDDSATNVARAEARAIAIAAACANDPLARHLGAASRIDDLEQVRAALGVNGWHAYVVGEAAWTFARYAERHPHAFARLLIDGGVDFNGPRSEIIDGRVAERGRRLRRLVKAIAADPVTHELGDSEDALWASIRALPRLPSETWLPHVETTTALRAILVMGHALAPGEWQKASTLRRRIAELRFSPRAENDAAMRAAVAELVARYGTRTGTDPFGVGPVAASPAMIATQLITLCNDDDSLHAEPEWWLAHADHLRKAWPGALGNDTFPGLVCAHWPRNWTRPWHAPSLPRGLPLLMVHAEYDLAAPLRGAVASFHPHSQVSLIVSRDVSGHEVADREDLPCIARAAGAFLFDGAMPGDKLTNCRAEGRRDA